MAEYRDFANLRPNHDVMVINFGLHFDAAHSRKYTSLLRAIAEEYARDREKLPITFWKETTGEHYDNPDHPSGYYANEKKDCKPYANLDVSYAADFRITLPQEILLPVGMPIMYIYNATRTEWWMHMARGDKAIDWTDCIHFCDLAGMHMYIREIFYNHLFGIFSPI